MRRREPEALLAEHACVQIRDKGKHTVWKAPSGALATVPRHAEIERFTARNICKALGIDPQNVTS